MNLTLETVRAGSMDREQALARQEKARGKEEAASVAEKRQEATRAKDIQRWKRRKEKEKHKTGVGF